VPSQVLEEEQRADALVAVGEGMVLHGEVEQVRGALLGGAVERLAIEGLFDGAKEAREAVVALSPEQQAGLATGADPVAQRADGHARLDEREWRDGSDGPTGALRQPVAVVFEEPVPRAGVVLDHVDDGLALVCDQRVRAECPGQESDGMARVAQADFLEAPLVQREAAHEVVAEGAGGPDAELGAALRVDPVADGENGVEVEELDVAQDLAAAFELNCGIFCRSCCSIQLAVREDPPQVLSDHGVVAAEQLGHLADR
jgi:hypothetical protein